MRLWVDRFWEYRPGIRGAGERDRAVVVGQRLPLGIESGDLEADRLVDCTVTDQGVTRKEVASNGVTVMVTGAEVLLAKRLELGV